LSALILRFLSCFKVPSAKSRDKLHLSQLWR
jgi:hypothetical protein